MLRSKLLTRYKNLKHFFLGKNEERLLKEEVNVEDIVSCQQVHGKGIRLHKDESVSFYARCDGMLTRTKKALMVRTADCLPIMLYAPGSSLIGMVHAGWKGLAKGIVARVIYTMCDNGATGSDINVFIGPHIGICCYNVDGERVSLFERKFPKKDYIKVREGKYYLDLGALAKYELRTMGVSEDKIEISPLCTSCESRFYSFRRNKTDPGRNLSLIKLM